MKLCRLSSVALAVLPRNRHHSPVTPLTRRDSSLHTAHVTESRRRADRESSAYRTLQRQREQRRVREQSSEFGVRADADARRWSVHGGVRLRGTAESMLYAVASTAEREACIEINFPSICSPHHHLFMAREVPIYNPPPMPGHHATRHAATITMCHVPGVCTQRSRQSHGRVRPAHHSAWSAQTPPACVRKEVVSPFA